MRKFLLLLTCLIVLFSAGSNASGEPRIVGGTSTSVQKWPWAVSLVERRDWQYRTVHSAYWGHYCTGTLLTRRYVLTARHCLTNGPFLGDYDVLVGRSNLSQHSRGERIQVIDAKRQTTWDSNGDGLHDMGQDWAVLELSRPARKGSPLGLHRLGGGVPSGALMQVAGWGFTETDIPRQLQEASVPRLDAEYCQERYPRPDGNWDEYHFLPEYQICAGYPEGGADSCMGDSGGPLVYEGRLVGIVSWGPAPCGSGDPGVYVRTDRWKGAIQRAMKTLQRRKNDPADPPIKEIRGWKPPLRTGWAVTGQRIAGVTEHSVSLWSNYPISNATISHQGGEPLCPFRVELFPWDPDTGESVPDGRCQTSAPMQVMSGRREVSWSGWSPGAGCPVVIIRAETGGQVIQKQYRSCQAPELA